MYKKQFLLLCIGITFSCMSWAQENVQKPQGGADEKTPSKSEYFAWINSTWEGSSEKETLANLSFFRWLKDTYGMQLDIYALDAGVIDGWKDYGNMNAKRFTSLFPNGFDEIAKYSADMNTGLGFWGGPDGFGETSEEARKRADMVVDLVKNNNIKLFKLDACCGNIRPKKFKEFNEMMNRVREIVPDFVLLNHRIDLGEGTAHSTTFLLGGQETYVDVHMSNTMTAPHHRAQNLERENSPELTRLSEDHGVCLSSCLDAWDDDLILQAFCRNLILSPEIYGNPWFLRDDEFSYLAYIFNLHRDYRDILVNGIELPENQYGPNSLSRGDESTRFITLRNLSWETRTFNLSLDSSIGLKDNGRKVKARLYHPFIEDKGNHKFGSQVEITVEPFRVALVKLTNQTEKDVILLSGVPYRIINDRIGDNCQVMLLGEAGKEYNVHVTRGKSAKKHFKVKFEGEKLNDSANRLVAEMKECPLPVDLQSIYYSTVFAADNDCLEARCIRRSGPTSIPQVQAARDAFFAQELYKGRECDSRNLFDADLGTSFSVAQFFLSNYKQSSFMLDFGASISLDSLVIDYPDIYSMQEAFYNGGAEYHVSDNLQDWREYVHVISTHTVLDCSKYGTFRYLRLGHNALRIAEISGFRNGRKVDSSEWRASNLFPTYNSWNSRPCKTWNATFTLNQIPINSYLCVAVNGKCGEEGVLAGFKINGKPVGCPDRAPSYKSNTWESQVRTTDHDYTFYLPLTPDLSGASFEAYVMSFKNDEKLHDLDIKVYMSAYPYVLDTKILNLKE